MPIYDGFSEAETSSPATPAKPVWRRWFGARSEQAAEGFLAKLGYKILARNYTCPFGELDIVAEDHGCIVFIEVRSTERNDCDRPAASVGAAKQLRLTKLALHFLQCHNLLGRAARFDVLALSWPAGRKISYRQSLSERLRRLQSLRILFLIDPWVVL